jgi:hypothetical protein
MDARHGVRLKEELKAADAAMFDVKAIRLRRGYSESLRDRAARQGSRVKCQKIGGRIWEADSLEAECVLKRSVDIGHVGQVTKY